MPVKCPGFWGKTKEERHPLVGSKEGGTLGAYVKLVGKHQSPRIEQMWFQVIPLEKRKRRRFVKIVKM